MFAGQVQSVFGTDSTLFVPHMAQSENELFIHHRQAWSWVETLDWTLILATLRSNPVCLTFFSSPLTKLFTSLHMFDEVCSYQPPQQHQHHQHKSSSSSSSITVSSSICQTNDPPSPCSLDKYSPSLSLSLNPLIYLSVSVNLRL